ncbi:hypothetical protein CYLTODRAFT_174854 [Cylindrobasidium torrendii FP15055 ss-10]|uniref:Uncharacterized protein n=1 Tax=Cylindrobasidium torrendii FP15055 ss-10 TaxID=1314674 RepID=A0A0D7BM02_9AGAR|nr:hypothetical protein CYLTODRAFT_174854 [Cylindrobasidium torrendii FP15055 ss-10]
MPSSPSGFDVLNPTCSLSFHKPAPVTELKDKDIIAALDWPFPHGSSTAFPWHSHIASTSCDEEEIYEIVFDSPDTALRAFATRHGAMVPTIPSFALNFIVAGYPKGPARLIDRDSLPGGVDEMYDALSSHGKIFRIIDATYVWFWDPIALSSTSLLREAIWPMSLEVHELSDSVSGAQVEMGTVITQDICHYLSKVSTEQSLFVSCSTDKMSLRLGFSGPENASEALAALRIYEFQGRRMHVDYSAEAEPQDTCSTRTGTISAEHCDLRPAGRASTTSDTPVLNADTQIEWLTAELKRERQLRRDAVAAMLDGEIELGRLEEQVAIGLKKILEHSLNKERAREHMQCLTARAMELEGEVAVAQETNENLVHGNEALQRKVDSQAKVIGDLTQAAIEADVRERRRNEAQSRVDAQYKIEKEKAEAKISKIKASNAHLTEERSALGEEVRKREGSMEALGRLHQASLTALRMKNANLSKEVEDLKAKNDSLSKVPSKPSSRSSRTLGRQRQNWYQSKTAHRCNGLIWSSR